MHYKDLKLSGDCTYFTFEGKNIFGETFLQALKFHSEGLAPVQDETGWFHIDMKGNSLYENRFNRVFGFYCNRATVIENESWFHLDVNGERVYSESYTWCGNFQENRCSVRNNDNQYFHIDLAGKPVYSEKYAYAGDYKDGYACVRLPNGKYKHIDKQGVFLNGKEYCDLGIFHKLFATAKDETGWFHIDKRGEGLYRERYLIVEPFYNGYALVTNFNESKQIIDEQGKIILTI